jgi:nitrogenase molybdenum-iron protein NifN
MEKHYVSTTNACKLCTPLGATLAFRGVEGAAPFLHGSQGCATYMRRYIISHFREPMDIASSSLGEKHAIYGGGPNLKKGLLTAMQKYNPKVIGIATTCLTETIGDDVPMLLNEFKREFADLPLAELVHVSTPSYSGTHMDGFHGAVRALAAQICRDKAPAHKNVNLMPGFVSAADLRHLKELCRMFGTEPTLLPDYSETLDGPALEEYLPIPAGGTKIEAIRAMSGAPGSIEFGAGPTRRAGLDSAGTWLESTFSVPLFRLGTPMGLRRTDAFVDALSQITGACAPAELELDRGRLLDAMVDGHKYISGLRAVVYGEEELVVALVSFLSEIGIIPVLVGSGAKGKNLAADVAEAAGDCLPEQPLVLEGVDFYEMASKAAELKPDLLVGNSKGYRYAREWDIPLIRVGFPIHDRFGGQRILSLGYRGALEMYDRIVNAILDKKQSDSPVGYGYL